MLCGAALKEYLGDEFEKLGKQYDACEVAKAYNGPSYPDILIDQASLLSINDWTTCTSHRPSHADVTPSVLEVPEMIHMECRETRMISGRAAT